MNKKKSIKNILDEEDFINPQINQKMKKNFKLMKKMKKKKEKLLSSIISKDQDTYDFHSDFLENQTNSNDFNNNEIDLEDI